jgi:hypothetical protein
MSKIMKKVGLYFLFAIAIMVTATAQEDKQKEKTPKTFNQHEFKLSYSYNSLSTLWETAQYNNFKYGSFTFSYMYRPIKWLWVGADMVNCFGTERYNWREYDFGGVTEHHRDKAHYGMAIAPTIRLSCLNLKHVVLYVSGSVGLAHLFSYTPENRLYWHATLFGINAAIGKKANWILGAEVGFGYKGIGNIHFGYAF